MGAFLNLKGQRFGRLLVTKYAGKNHKGLSQWHVRCDCGNRKVLTIVHLRPTGTQSCGCLHVEQSIENLKHAKHDGHPKHGHTSRTGWSPEYQSYHGAKQRCTNPRNQDYPDYGGRGIEFRFENFQEFLAAVGLRPEPNRLYSIDRFPDKNGHYEKGNVRWATTVQQANNKRPYKQKIAA
jgi:hypothetical protein